MNYWIEFNRITKKYERQYAQKIGKALKDQVNAYLKTKDLDSINADGVYKVLNEMHSNVGVNWAFQSNKYLRAKKARKPLGFSNRIIQILQSQYGADLLNMSQNISQTTKDQIRAILQQAAAEGWSVDEITRRIQSPTLTSARSQLIARTEVIGAANAGAMANAQTLGATVKVWIAAIDNRTRKDHITLDGQKVGINEYFTVVDKNGVTRRMMQPGDKTGGPAQVCNCRCAVGFEMDATVPVQSPVTQGIQMPEVTISRPSFVSAASLKEAEKWALDNLNVKYVNFKGLDLGVANDINKAIHDIKRIMPDIRTNGIGSAQEGNKAVKKAIIEAYKKGTYYQKLLSIYGKDEADRAATRYANGQVDRLGPNTIAWSAGRREVLIPGGDKLNIEEFIGVYVNNKYGSDKASLDKIIIENEKSGWYVQGAKNFGYIMAHEIGHEIDGTLGFRKNPKFLEIFNREHALGKDVLSQKLSRYGATAAGRRQHLQAEMIAEAWAEFISSPTPRPLAVEIGELMLKEYYNKSKDQINMPYDKWAQTIRKLLKK